MKERRLKDDSYTNRQLLKTATKTKKLYQFMAIIIATAFVSSAITLTITADGPTGFGTVIEPGSLTESAKYTIFKDQSTVYLRNGTSGAIEFSSTNTSYLFQQALELNNQRPRGTILVKAGEYDFSYTVNLPASELGYRIQGEFYGTNDVITGTVFNANAGLIGSTLFDLDHTSHSNNIQISTITFNGGTHALSCLLNLSQPATQSATHLVEYCMFYGTAVTDCLLNLDNAEDSLVDRCQVRASFTQVGLKFRAAGGLCRIWASECGGETWLGSLQVTMVDCSIGAGGIEFTKNIQCSAIFTGLWIESSGAFQPFIRNYGGALFLTINGGRWNSESSQPYLYGNASGHIYAIATGVVWASNDASTCYLKATTSTGEICVRIYSCTITGGAAINNCRAFHRGVATITAGNTYVDVTHSIYKTPTTVVVSGSLNVTVFTPSASIGATTFRASIGYVLGSDILVYWYCEA